MSRLITLGIMFLFLGMIFLFLGSMFTAVKGEKSAIKTAGGVFIGPFPLFGWASDKRMFYTLITVMVVLTILYLFIGRKL